MIYLTSRPGACRPTFPMSKCPTWTLLDMVHLSHFSLVFLFSMSNPPDQSACPLCTFCTLHCICLCNSCLRNIKSLIFFRAKQSTLCQYTLHTEVGYIAKLPAYLVQSSLCTFCARGARLTSDIISTLPTFGFMLPPYKALPTCQHMGSISFQNSILKITGNMETAMLSEKKLLYRTKYLSFTDLTGPYLFLGSLVALKFHDYI